MFIRAILMLMFPVLIGQCSAVGGMGEIKGYLPGSVYHSVRAGVFQQCRKLCLYAIQCSSINYNPTRRLCELNSNMDNPGGQLEHRWNWIHAKMDTETKTKKCSFNKCPGSKLCVPVFNSADLCLTSLPGQKLATNNLKSLESSSALLQSSGIEAKQQVSAIDSDVMVISPSSTTLSTTQKQHTDQSTTPDTGSATQTACHDLVSSSCSARKTTDIQTEQLPIPSKGDYSCATETKTISFSASSGISTSIISSVSASSRNSILTTNSDVLTSSTVVAASTNSFITTAVTNSIFTASASASTQMASTRQNKSKFAPQKHRALTQRPKPAPQKHRALTQRPKPAPQKHRAFTQRPKPARQKHRALTQRPKPAPQKHKALTQRPKPALQKHKALPQRPKPAPQKHRVLTQRSKPAPSENRAPRERLTYTAEQKIMLKKKLASTNPGLVRCANFQLPFKEERDTCTVPNMIRRDGGECQCETGFHYDPRNNKCVRRCRKYGKTLILQSRLMCIGGHNNKHFRSSREEECISACVKEKTFVCRSIDFWKSTCYLSIDTRADVTGAWSPWCGCVFSSANLC